MNHQCTQLGRNSPYKDFVYINLDTSSPQTTDKDWAEALSRNEYVDTIQIVLPRTDAKPEYTTLLKVISSHKILEKVILYQYFAHSYSEQRKSAQLLAPYLQAIQLNPAVCTVSVNLVQFTAATFAQFLNNAPMSLTRLELFGHYAKVTKEGVSDLAASIQQNTNLKTILLGKLRDGYMCPILNSLTLNSSVENLILRSPTQRAPTTAQAVKHLLQSTTSISSFTLQNLHDTYEHFLPIAQGLLSSKSVTNLAFDHCFFFGESGIHFKNILQSKNNLHSLSVCSGDIEANILSAENFIHLLGSHSLLESFELRDVNMSTFGFSSPLKFNSLLQAVEKSSQLKTFVIGHISQQNMYEALLSSIPKIQVQTLLFSLESNLSLSPATLLAVMNINSSIVCLEWKQHIRHAHPNNNTVLDYNQEHKLNSYLARNKSLYQWKTSYSNTYSSLPKEVWPKTFTAIQPMGATTIYAVICMLDDAIGPPVNQSKKKEH
jgi:hypothetical protein